MENSPIRLSFRENTVGHKSDCIPGEKHVQQAESLLVRVCRIQAHRFRVFPDKSAEPSHPEEGHPELICGTLDENDNILLTSALFCAAAQLQIKCDNFRASVYCCF